MKSPFYQDDTIAAIATPLGEGAIAVVRVSGKEAISVVSRVFRGKSSLQEAAGNTVHFGRLVDPSGSHIDNVLATVFRAPRSYTGEDVVEVSCHGGLLNTRRVLQAILVAGARQAQPGEFTRRAFLNGKMDLSQAEAVASLIVAKCEAARSASLRQLEGKFSDQIRVLRAELLDLLSLVELELDFSEEGIDLIQKPELLARLSSVGERIQRMADSYRLGKVYRDGVSVAIIGKPNAGKSSLFNALLREDRAIVTDIPGTTRDTLEEAITIDGVMFRLSDTAGLRDSDDPIEQEGMSRTVARVRQSDIALLVVDATTGASRESAVAYLNGVALPELGIVAYNKIDLCAESLRSPQRFRWGNTDYREVFVSAKTGLGLDTLRNELVNSLPQAAQELGEVQVTNERHYDALVAAHSCLSASMQALVDGRSTEFIADDIRRSCNALAEIVGEVTTDDILTNIFSKFCIGK